MINDKCTCHVGESKPNNTPPHKQCLAGLKSEVKQPLDQMSFDSSYPLNLPLTPVERVGVEQCDDE
jgi:hypothetical protein